MRLKVDEKQKRQLTIKMSGKFIQNFKKSKKKDSLNYKKARKFFEILPN